MKPRDLDPRKLDVAALATQAAHLAGRWPLAELSRLADMSPADHQPGAGDEVLWSVRGERRERSGTAPQTWLHLALEATVRLQCQRCLEPVAVALKLQRALRFVPGEAEAAALDAESDDDVLALSRSLDLRELAEDELLLALPLVPCHATCPQPLPLDVGVGPDAAADPAVRRPFDVLQILKDQGGGQR